MYQPELVPSWELPETVWGIVFTDAALKPPGLSAGAAPLLEAARKRRLFIGLCSSRPKEEMREALSKANAEEVLKCAICADDERLNKEGACPWNVVADLARHKVGAAPSQLLAIVCDSEEACSALLQHYGLVLVCSPSTEGWDRPEVTELLQREPELKERLIFMGTLEGLQW